MRHYFKYRLNAMRILQKELAVQELGNFSFWNAINKTSRYKIAHDTKKIY